MVRATMSKELIFKRGIKRVCMLGKVCYQPVRGLFEERRGRRWHKICRLAKHYGDPGDTLLCKHEDITKTQQIAKLLEKEGIASQINILVVSSILLLTSTEDQCSSLAPSPKQPLKFCTHCGGQWIPDRRGRCSRCGAIR